MCTLLFDQERISFFTKKPKATPQELNGPSLTVIYNRHAIQRPGIQHDRDYLNVSQTS